MKSLREEIERELALFGNRLFEHRLTWRNLDEDETEEYFRVQREFVDKHIKAILKAVKDRIEATHVKHTEDYDFIAKLRNGNPHYHTGCFLCNYKKLIIETFLETDSELMDQIDSMS